MVAQSLVDCMDSSRKEQNWNRETGQTDLGNSFAIICKIDNMNVFTFSSRASRKDQ